ncbi:MAG: GAF domain-containing protein [Anaerolineae bacterium]|nr:GAF domain-containing protein [Anaerolineae bacterium]
MNQSKFSFTRRLAVIGAGLIIYTLLFVVTYTSHSHVRFIMPLYLLPILAAAWAFGLRGALSVGLIALPYNSLLMSSMGGDLTQILSAERLAGAILGLVTSAIIGRLFDLQYQLRQQLDERIQAEQREHAHTVFAQALSHISTVLNMTLDLNEVFDRILISIDHVAPCDTAGIVLIDGDAPQVVQQRTYVEHVEDLQWSSANARHLVRMSSVDQVIIIENLPKQVGSCVSAPIRLENQTIGFLILRSHQPHAFTEIHLSRLEAFANQAAVAIKNARLYKALESNAIELNMLYQATSFLLNASSLAEIGHQIAQAVIQEFVKADCGVMLLDPDNGTINRLARAGQFGVNTDAPLLLDGDGLVPEALRQGKIIYSPDVRSDPRYANHCPHTRSELVIPLKARGDVLGVLDLQSQESDAFDARDRRILAAFAEQAAIAIDNMRLYDTLHQFALDREQTVIERTGELHRAKERVEAILNSSSDTIIMTMPDGHIEQSNRAFYDLFGYYIDEEFDWPLTRLVIPEHVDALQEVLKLAFEEHQPQRIEVTARRKDGSCFDADLALSPIFERTSDGCRGIVCSLRDITERKRMEQELREALNKERELRELKSRFVSMASHEFRTPLATILATTSLLRNYIDRMDEAKKERQFEKVEEQIRYMTGLLDDVLTIGHMEAGRVQIDSEALDLYSFFEEMVEEFHQIRSTHQVDFQSEGNRRPIPADRKFIREIVNNLLTNAAKYSPDGSPIDLDLIYEPDQVVFHVRDRGIGIPEKDQSRLFEAFHRAENVGTRPGTGLGLAIIKHAVDLHGGSITFESKVNVGTTFTVCIPIREVERVVT